MASRGGGKGAKKKAKNAGDTNDDLSSNHGQSSPLPCADEATVSSAGHSSVVQAELATDEFNDTLQRRIVQALCTPDVIEVITKAVSDAIMDSVTQRVYESIDLDMQSRMKVVQDLERSIGDLENKLTKVTNELKEQELYSRRNCLRIYGMAESSNEDTDDIVLELVKEKLEIELTSSDIDRSHRLQVKRSEGSRDPNPLLVKFTRYNMRDRVYRARSKLRGTKIFINEHLTKDRQILFSKVRSNQNVRKAWTSDFKITALTKDNKKVRINTERDLEKL